MSSPDKGQGSIFTPLQLLYNGSPSLDKGKGRKKIHPLPGTKATYPLSNDFHRTGSYGGAAASIYLPLPNTDIAVLPTPPPPLLVSLCRVQMLYIQRGEVKAVHAGELRNLFPTVWSCPSHGRYVRQKGEYRRQGGAVCGGGRFEGEVEGREAVVDQVEQGHDRLRQ